MKRTFSLVMVAMAFLGFIITGCAKKDSPTGPAPVATATPVPVATSTPMPVATATPVPVSASIRYEITTTAVNPGSAIYNFADTIAYFANGTAGNQVYNQALPWTITTSLQAGVTAQVMISLQTVVTGMDTSDPLHPVPSADAQAAMNTQYTLEIYKNDVLVKTESFVPVNTGNTSLTINEAI